MRVSSRITLLVVALVGLMSLFIPVRAAYAWCSCCSCVCPYMCCNKGTTQIYIKQAFNQYRSSFIMNSFYTNQYQNDGLKPMADALRNQMMTSAHMIGSFIDGASVNAAQTELNSLNAMSLRDYQVSDAICKFGTLSRSLAATEAKMTAQQIVLGEVGLARNLGKQHSAAATGRGRDNSRRLFSFVKYFCDPADNNSGLAEICKPSGSSTATRDTEYNRDIDFTRTIDDKATLNIDLTDDTLSRDENSVVALGSFIYGHRQDTDRIGPSEINESKGAVEEYALVRSIVARRAVAQNTYNAIVSMKSGGSGASKGYMEKVLEQLGLSSDETKAYLGAKYKGASTAGFDDEKDPSYYAQMDILTKRIYQDPVFYANLMDTRANVKRISASLEALDLAQGRDMFKSSLRSEMLMAVLLELEAGKSGEEIGANLSTEIKE